MNSESPSIQKVKSCNACKRQLPIYYFGIRKHSLDGYNPCCKDCRNFRRRQSNSNLNDNSGSIMPLDDHNRHFLWAIPDSSAYESVVGIDLKTLEQIDVILKYKRRQGYWITINMPNGLGYTYLHGGQKSEFVTYAVLLLNRLQVRLFYTADKVVLANWGARSKSSSQNETASTKSI